MGEFNRFEAGRDADADATALSNKLNFLDLAQYTEQNPEPSFDDVYTGLGPTYRDQPQQQMVPQQQQMQLRPSNDVVSRFDAQNNNPGHGALSSASLLTFMGGIALGMAKGRGSLQARALQGLAIGAAVEVGRQEVANRVKHTFGF